MAFYGHAPGARGIADAYDKRLVPWLFDHWAERVVAMARPEPSARAMDLACGTGLITRSLLQRLSGGGRVHGVDADLSMLAYAARSISDPRVSWLAGDAGRLALGSGVVDVVVCNQGLQFFPDRPKVLAEMRRVVRPGGRVALAVWGSLEQNPWPAAMAAALGEALGAEAERGTESVCSLGDPRLVHELLVGTGFIHVEVTDVQLTATHPDVGDAIDGQLAAVPSAAAIEALGARARGAVIDAMADRLGDYIDSRGAVSVPSTSVLATAVAPG